MACNLPAPQWVSLPGLIQAKENIADGYINISINEAVATLDNATAYYLVYYSSNPSTVFNVPKLIATATQVSIPGTLVTVNQYIAVRTAQLGISSHIDTSSLTKVNDNLYLYPPEYTLESSLSSSDGYMLAASSANGFPSDGYALVGNEIIQYQNIVDGYDGYVGLGPLLRDPFCNNPSNHAVGESIFLFKGFEDKNSIALRPLATCGLDVPSWYDKDSIGIKQANDLGLGTSLELNWFPAKSPAGNSKTYYNIYQADGLINMLSRTPLGFSSGYSAIIPNVIPGKGYYYLVRAAYQLNNLDESGFEQLSSGFFKYPDKVTTTQAFNTGQVGTLFVSSTAGFPFSGYLNIASEVLRYSGITNNTFNITGRDVFTIDAVKDYPSGTAVVFFKGIEETNRYYYRTEATWDKDSNVPRMPGGPDYNQDADGYRSIGEDDVTEDHSEEENQNEVLPTFNYCGYRAQDYTRLYSRNVCGTYSGGRQDGFAGGIDVAAASTQRAEQMIQLTGVPFILLRRKHTGKQCPGLSLRTEHPRARCGICYGTEFLGGYDRIYSPRQLSPGVDNPNGFILMRINPYVNDLDLTPDRGLAQVDQLDVWALPAPIIKDRDVVVRFIIDDVNHTYIEEFRYEILNVTRNKLLFDKDGIQKASIKKLDKTREVMKFPITII